jgi:hypothetical protein
MIRIERLITTLVLLLSTCIIGYAQTRVLVSGGNAELKQYAKFSTPIKISPKYSNLEEVKNKKIEDLMSSILCASNQEWVNFNTLGGAKNATVKKVSDFEAILKRDNSKTYMELLSKMNFDFNGEELCVVKFRYFIEQAPNGVVGAYQLQNVEGRWYQTSRTDLSKIALLNMFMKPTVIEQLLNGKPTDNRDFNKLLAKVNSSKGVDFEKLYQEFSSWENDKEKTDLFTEPAW